MTTRAAAACGICLKVRLAQRIAAALQGREPGVLTFRAFRETNVARCVETWHELGVWSLTDWATALAGEVGEACNVIKKLRRSELPGPKHINPDPEKLRADLQPPEPPKPVEATKQNPFWRVFG